MCENKIAENRLEDLLPEYYKRLFPYKEIHRCKREIAFILKGEVFVRYLSFNNAEEFAKKIQEKTPFKIDIGAVYTHSPELKRTVTEMVPIAKEIVFDIDMDDYDEIRTCCVGAKICLKCWKFMIVACKILDAALREDFKYKYILWVFSGRRGIHCWVCDESARRICSDETRSHIAEYLQVIKGGHYNKRVKLADDWIHPSIERALKIIDKYFQDILIEQNLLNTAKQLETLLNYINDDSTKRIIKEAVMKKLTTQDRWNCFVETFESLLQNNEIPKHLRNLISELKLHYTYPRLDINVTKSTSHLLKTPFCVHPGTDKICVPIDPKLIDTFNPHTVPTIGTLTFELRTYDMKSIEEKIELLETLVEEGGSGRGGGSSVVEIKAYKQTSLLKAIDFFIEFINDLRNQSKRKRVNVH